MSGDSGEGKSLSCLMLQLILLRVQGIDLKQYMDAINVYTPVQYPQKLHALLHDKELKKINIICVHEAREIVKAKLWQSFLTQAIADINAMSRSIKRLCIMIVSQFIRDITTDVRYTINFYMKVHRRHSRGSKARVQIYTMWKDDRDLEKPHLRKRRLMGYVVDPKGRYKRFIPKYLELDLPPQDICDHFDKQDTEAKINIINRKIDKLIKEMQSDMYEENKKIDMIIDWYMNHTEQIEIIGKRVKNKWKIRKEAKEVHQLSDFDMKELEEKLNKKMKESGMIAEA